MKFVLLACGLLAIAQARPQLSHEAAVKALKQTQYDLSQPYLPQVPGLAAHQAAEAQVLAAQVTSVDLHTI